MEGVKGMDRKDARERAMEELDNDWTTSMELADTLEREHKVPFFGICLGLQIAVIEFARDVAGLKAAGFNVAILDAAPSVSVQFHTKNPNAPWADVRVREADDP